MRAISKSFFGVKVLHEVDFDVVEGEVVAICGENGAGKSTLMKILSAVYLRDEGTVAIKGKEINQVTPHQMHREGVSMIHQELNLIEDMTVAQNIFLTREPTRYGVIDYNRMNKEAEAILKRLEQDIKPTTMVGSLKIAQKQMVEIAKAISFDVKVIIMDEPTATLTNVDAEILFNLIKNLVSQGIGIVYVTHRLSEVKRIANRVTILRDGRLITTRNVDEVTEKEIASLMVGRDVDDLVADNFEGDPSDIILDVKNISGDMLKDVSFSVARGEILGFNGLVGAGRSELMEMLFGIRKFNKGTVLLNGEPITIKRAKAAISAGLGFATEDRKGTGLILERSISENADLAYRVKYKGNGILWPKGVRLRTNEMIDRLRVVCRGPNQLVRNLSGGNQQKVVLAKWLSSSPDIFIVDEPTRGIDVGARAEIYNIIRELARDGKTIIIVSSDVTEVLSICQRIIVMHEGTVTGELVGNERTEDRVMQYAFNVMQKEV
jgi:ABC-type sugar transport system ATPase subunit